MPNQTHTALPHLPAGMSMPQINVGEQPVMPGVKTLPVVEWKDDDSSQVVPQADPGSQTVVQRRASSRQGLPVTERTSTLGPDVEPPPMFSAKPNKAASVIYTREPKSQKQVYRMESGIDPVTLLSGRLESWRLAIKNLVSVFKKIAEAEENASKSWIGAGKTVNVPFKDSQGQFLQSGGIQDVWAAIRDYSNEHGIIHHSFSTYVRDALIPALRGVKEDIKKMVISVQGDKQLKSTEIFNSRLKVDRNIARLDKSIQAVERAPNMAHQSIDPFLANLSVIHSVRELCDHENRLHDHALQLQQEAGMFELKVIESLRFILKNLQDFRLQNKMEYMETIGMIQSTFDNIQPTTEWNDFIQRNQSKLVMENSAYKTESSVDYPNQNHRLVRASKIGQIHTKTGATKNTAEGVFILTPTGYLHGYKTAQYFQSNPLEPSYSVFLPNATVSMDESDPNGFIIRPNKSGKMAAVKPDKSYTLLAHSPEEAKDWFGVLSASSTQYQVTHLIDTTRPTFSSIQQNRNLPPLPASTLPIIDDENAHDQPESSAQAQNSAGSETHDDAEVVSTTYQIEEGRGSLDATTSASHPQDSSQVVSYEHGDGEVMTTEPQNLSSFPDGDVDLYSAPEEMNQKQATQDSATPLHEQSEHEVSSSGIQNTTTTNENATSIGDPANAQTTSEIQNASNIQTDSETVPTLSTHSASKGPELDNTVSSPETDIPVQDISSNIQNKSALVTDEYADPTLSSEALTESTSQDLPSHKTYDANLNEQHDPSNVPLRGEDELQYRDPPTHIDPNNATHVA